MDKQNIVLVGFMGTGKTRTAQLLASQLSMDYVGIDDEIERREKMSINDIFRLKGESFFRKVEKEMVAFFSSGAGQVIDCGGGVVLDPENMRELGQSGHIFCLWADPAEIYRRVKDSPHRPLLNVEDPVEKIKQLLEERKEFYLKARFQVDTTGLSPLETVGEIRRILDVDGRQ